MLSLVTVLDTLKPVVPGLLIVGTAVPYFIMSLGWHVVSFCLPCRWVAFVDDKMYSMYQRMILFFFENVSGVKLVLYGDVDKFLRKPEKAIYISNHQCSVDWAVVDILALRQGCLGGLRYVLKDSLSYIPLYGWYFYMHGCVYVRRERRFKQDITCRQLSYLRQLDRPFWLVIFPEGTRYNTQRKVAIEKSQEYAVRRGLMPFTEVLMPRIRGFRLVVDQLRHHADAVYDATVVYESSTHNSDTARRISPDMCNFVCGSGMKTLHVKIRRYPIAEIPEDEEQLERWLYDRFLEKERDLKKCGKIRPKSEVPFAEQPVEMQRLPLHSTLPSLAFLSATLLPLLVTDIGRKVCLTVLTLGSIGGIVYMKVRNAV